MGLMAKGNCIHGVRSTGQGAGPAAGWPLPHANSSPILEGKLLPDDHKSQGWGQALLSCPKAQGGPGRFWPVEGLLLDTVNIMVSLAVF